MPLQLTGVLGDINKIVDFVGLQPEQSAVDAWIIDKASTILNNLPAVPANLQPLVTLTIYSWYVDAGLPAPPALIAQVKALGGTVVAPTLTVTPSTFTVTHGQTISESLAVTGGVEPYSVSNLPAGVETSLSGSNVIVFGSIAEPGAYTFQVVDSSSPALSATVDVTAS